ncbi:AGC protein kinase Gad8 [Rhizophlyctis rosea]|uniref:non-specific serine/threonine protein kinase n=1 Tax=Rhizophlyctis rosea TaxID=64517 RepID=A0AAD5X7E0_9FUNG|nr:AGC protein kinase Gad8 [Rhizophlyctis rosea]
MAALMTKDQKSPGQAAAPQPSTNTPSTSSPSTPSAESTNDSSSASSAPLPPGMLLIRVVEARNLALPNGTPLQIGSGDKAKAESSGSGGTVLQTGLPYVVIDFDKNEVLVAAKEGNPASRSVTWQHRAHFDVSREAEVTVFAYQRGSGSSNDTLIGTVRVKPIFVDNKLIDEWFQLTLADQPNSVGEIHLQICFKKALKGKPMSIDDFDLLKVLGKGSFGKVMQVRKKDTNRIYAMKIIRKAHIVQRSEVTHTLAERTVLAKINHPFIVPLKFSFQSAEKLYLVLAFVNGGELFHHLQNEGKFAEDRARFYAAELLCALECLHGYNIIYRDLKPENILLDYTGHIALCDFGLCKLNMKEGNKTNTFCGTPEYLAPELLIGQGYTKVVDWWTIGILLYEMLCGLPPFYDENTNEMYKKILTDELKFENDVSSVAKDLLRQLLNRDANARLGANGADEIKRHPFFADINWGRLMARKYAPPFRPNVSSATDTSNFDEEFTSEMPTDSLSDSSALSESVQQQFAGFTYQPTEAIAGSLIQGGGGSLIAPSKMSVAGSFAPMGGRMPGQGRQGGR